MPSPFTLGDLAGKSLSAELPETPEPTGEAPRHAPASKGTAALALAALGVVFGDIGTSPLYSFKECVGGHHHVPVAVESVLGVGSLILWSLILIVAVKYLTFVLKADNHGEGGVLALLALVPDKSGLRGRITWLAALILLGGALLYGDGLITPAISVLSAVEGLSVATDAFDRLVVPLTCAILFALFLIQRRGTQRVGHLFGPVMILWFLALAGLGIAAIVRHPAALVAVDPRYAIRFLAHTEGTRALWVLGSVVLAITGCEALYADMGHFGKRPIKICWYGLVMPALALNYIGQAAVLMADPSKAANPFFALVPRGIWTYVLVVLATAATVIASQALISGVYSLTNQAIQLGFFPRVTVRHTSRATEGQIFLPEINWGLALACIALVLAFRESGRLAAAYGMAVTGTMAITSVGFYVVATRTWGWSRWRAVPLLLFFLCLDLPFLVSNLMKFFEGAWIPLAIGAGLFAVMVTWKRGRSLLAIRFRERAVPMAEFFSLVDDPRTVRVEGTSVFMASSPDFVPPILVHHLRNNRALHDLVILLTVASSHAPAVRGSERVRVAPLGKGVWRVVATYGFMEQPDAPAVIRSVCGTELPFFDTDDVIYYIGRETFVASDHGGMSRPEELLFAFLSRNALSATAYFRIPSEQVVELGMQLDL